MVQDQTSGKAVHIMITDPKTVTPGFYWFMPLEPGVEPHPCKVALLEWPARLVKDRELEWSSVMVLWYIGEGWYEPLEDALHEGDLVPLPLPEGRR